jgi:hypothetical protein
MNYLLAILGIIATIIIGYWGVRLTIKTRRSVSMAFVEREFIPLFKTIIKNFNSLEIKYKNKPITENLVLIKTSLVNDGNTDIDKSMIYKSITIYLPENFKCIEETITEKSENVNASISSINNEVLIEWDLLKKDEYISFDLLVEVSTDKEKETQIEKQDLDYYKIDQRITNLKDIKKYNIDFHDNEKISKSRMIRKKVFTWMLIIMGLVLSLMILFHPERKFSLNYFLGQSKLKHELKITPINNLEIKLESKMDSLKTTIPVTQLKNKYDINFGINKEPFLFYFSLIYGIFLLGVGLALLIIQKQPEREKTLRKIIKNKA